MTVAGLSKRSAEQAHAWELRSRWAKGRRGGPVVLLLDLPEANGLPVIRADVEGREDPVGTEEIVRVEGFITYVAMSGAYVLVDDGQKEPLHVPCARILSILSPHFTQE